MKIKFINLDRQYDRIKYKINSGVQEVFSKCNFIMGDEIFELENKLQKYLKLENAICCSSGSDALIVALMALGIGPGDCVITTPFSFIASADSISMVGATPVFVDVYQHSFNIDVNEVEKKIKNSKMKFKAILAVDIFGQQAYYDKLREIADENELFLIQDAAQSFGSKYKGKNVGYFSDVATTSFFPTKPLGCYGDGGAIFTKDNELASKIRSIIQHGKGDSKYHTIRFGFNGRLDTIQAVVLLEKLKILDEEIILRENVAKKYNEKLGKVVVTPSLSDDFCFRNSWAQYSILTNERDKIQKHLKNSGVPTNIYYPIPLHLQPVYNNFADHLLVVENICKRILSLPMCPYLEECEIDYICDLILERGQ
jgi:dTDP-4-amino-4,6-dideoxygalactose transaminase